MACCFQQKTYRISLNRGKIGLWLLLMTNYFRRRLSERSASVCLCVCVSVCLSVRRVATAGASH